MTKIVAFKLIDGADRVALVLWKNAFPKLSENQFRQHAAICARLIAGDRSIKLKAVRKTVRTRVSLHQKRRRLKLRLLRHGANLLPPFAVHAF